MAHYFKIVGRIYTTGATGTDFNLKYEYEFISDPFTDPEECITQMKIKGKEYLSDLEPVNRNPTDISLNARFLGNSNNGQPVFKKPKSKGGFKSTLPEDQYAEQRRELMQDLYRTVYPDVQNI